MVMKTCKLFDMVAIKINGNVMYDVVSPNNLDKVLTVVVESKLQKLQCLGMLVSLVTYLTIDSATSNEYLLETLEIVIITGLY